MYEHHYRGVTLQTWIILAKTMFYNLWEIMNQTTTKPKGSIQDLKILILLGIPYIVTFMVMKISSLDSTIQYF
jgi:hypothetical protein